MKMDKEIITKAEGIVNARTGYIGNGMEGYAALALIDENGYPTASTLTIAKADGIKWITFNTSLSRDSVKRIQGCNRASVCINSSGYNITLVGTVEILTDPIIKRDMWFPLMKGQWSGPDDPEYCVLRFTTERYSLFVDYNEIKGTLR
jgi:general stress protein 26